MCKELKQFDYIGTARCTTVSENFATIEDFMPMHALKLQEMFDMGWELMYAPVITYEDKYNPMFIHTFKKIIFHG